MAAWLATPMLESGPKGCFKNQYVSFSISVERLLLDSAKPHVLLRHAKTQLHLQAVASMLSVSFGAHVNATLKMSLAPPTRLRVLV